MQGEFVGTFHKVEAGYGFLKDVKARNSNEPHPDVFVRVTVIKQTLDWPRKTLVDAINQRKLRFRVRPSERHPERFEAFAVHEAADWHLHD
ncbi:MAG: hypothetical protein KBE09_01190 [Candidatus Pacebacteria bacterium]|nr:hypothetical protein [Candidatus Paceibacterota bacterium]